MFSTVNINRHLHHNNDIPSDPHVFGPGMWISYHILAYNSKTYDEHVIYCKTARYLSSGIPCHTCREHAKEFIKLNPPEKSIVDNDPKCMFRWSCSLHNNANMLTGKSIVDWNIMYDKYASNSPQCTTECAIESLSSKSKISTKENILFRMPPKVIIDNNINKDADKNVSQHYNHKMYIKNANKRLPESLKDKGKNKKI